MPDQHDVDGVNGVTEQDFIAWKHNPVTKWVRDYLGDFAEALRRDHLIRWEQSSELDVSYEAEAKGRVRLLSEIVSLSYADVAGFYYIPPTAEEEDEPQADQDLPGTV